jgi:hypothetical protein
MSKWTQLVLLAIVLIVAALFRLSDLDWDAFNHYHPDERYIAWVATTVEIPQDLATGLKPQESTFNPFYWPAVETTKGIVVERDTPRKFAYGHLPLYLGVSATKLATRLSPFISELVAKEWSFTQDILNVAGRNEFRHITAVGRATTALVDIASVGLLFLFGRLLYSPQTGLLAAALLAVSVLPIQLSHFFTVDPYLTFFILLTLSFLVLSVREKSQPRSRIIFLLAAGGCAGLAVGSKFSGILLLLPLTVAVFMQVRWKIAWRVLLLALTLFVSLLLFFLTNPFAILDSTCQADAPAFIGFLKIPPVLSQSCYLQNVIQQGTMVRGLRDVPFVRQYIGTIPYVYYVEMLFRWGMGPLLTLVGFTGFGWAIWRFARAFSYWWRSKSSREYLMAMPVKIRIGNSKYMFSSGELILLAWAVPFFLSTGALSVKFLRYMLPLIPILILYGAAMLLSIKINKVRRVAVAAVLVLTGLFALAFINIYRQPHPWIAASSWIFDNLESGAVVVGEVWDDQLPDNLIIGDLILRRSKYEIKEVNWLSGTEQNDNVNKLQKNLETLAEADYVVLSSNRNYGVIPRLPERYPLSSQYYQLLFDGRLGHEVVYVGSRMPNLLGIYLKPDSFTWPGLKAPEKVNEFFNQKSGPNWGRFDESFTVYDQPLVIIMANQERKTATEMEALFKRP